MRQILKSPSLFLLALLTGQWFATNASAQSPTPVSLQEQLKAFYRTVSIGPDGAVQGDPGTLLEVQKAGILAMPWKAHAMCPSKFQDNVLHLSTGFCAGMMQGYTGYRYFLKGGAVYPWKVDVNIDKGKISFQIVSCNECYKTSAPFPAKGELIFEFPKGYLEKADAATVENTIGQMFTVTTMEAVRAQVAAAEQQQAANQQQQQAPADQQSPAEPEQQAEPQTVQMGMTTDQVQSALGKPDKIFNLGAKQIYVYKDVKITFMNGKVSDVQ